jgi:hypothetical protein
MKTFFNILRTLAKDKNKDKDKDKKYPDDPFQFNPVSETNELNNAIQLLINEIYYKRKNYKGKRNRDAYSKLASLSSVLNNVFYKKELKEKLTTIFSQAQKHSFAFSKLALMYKFYKYKVVVYDDLSLNPLDPKHRNTFVLIDQKCKYLFSIHDLVSIIENAIGNAPDFFAEPLMPSNPYNKQPFTYATLYNIYFKLKVSTRVMPILFHLFFLENFHKTSFCENHEEYIRDNAIKRYVNNMPYTTLYPYVMYMLKNDIYTEQYNIHPEFPKDILVNIFRPYLYYFFIVKHSTDGTNKFFNYRKILDTKLKRFYKFNECFGRKHIQITRYFGEVIKIEHSFNMKHINFYGVKVEPVNEIKVTYNNPLGLLYSNTDEINSGLDMELDVDVDVDEDINMDNDSVS